MYHTPLSCSRNGRCVWPFLEEDGGVWYMNPGAARDGRYGVIEMKDGAFTCELKELPE